MGAVRVMTAPDLLEGHRYTGDLRRTFEEQERFSYDAIQKRIYVFRRMLQGSSKMLEVVDIMLFQQSVMYQFYPQNKTCVMSALHTPFQPIAVPSDAKFVTQMYAGGSSEPREGVLANVWSLTPQEGDISFLSYTDFNCVPLSEVSHRKGKGWIFATFMNLNKTIHDPSVFTPPPECSHLD
ncbi:mammalian ependymin-related protein 1-like isoform X2 [Stegostoma tigrinum]|uniref:mammalian ependymin-related protein 1-like isoform X2 n=1 Tax=Stegostoma tigrinum TaxID=3053191 RepID=UPI00202B6FCE|nr:mammalian ependymin-related protein 1-like isoform X2 [Stegostoma tigrinum]